ncbi:neuropeptide S receptor-like [Saccoglossus kowalevskii]|uniref:Cardioacceleratory peptide receptor-like n=1 Tax=Saccoglossus kowalevskii TaxID=10224 RepID=A0ABM0H0K0_SACKO|nr:PREDICTED: cardioacceleratory peptide receptor-like [Saccoglossus kowalevskii]
MDNQTETMWNDTTTNSALTHTWRTNTTEALAISDTTLEWHNKTLSNILDQINDNLTSYFDIVDDVLPLSRDGNSSNLTLVLNDSNLNSSGPSHYNKETRIIAAWVLFAFGIVGNILVCLWMWTNRRRKSRMNLFILMLTIADLMVCFLAMLYVIIIEELNYIWIAGNVICKVFNFVQSAAMMASTNMLVVIAVDRHQAIRSPLKEAFSAGRMVCIAWATGFLCSTPQLYVWSVHTSNGISRCGWPIGTTQQEKQAYITYIAFIVFFLPFIIISVAYIRIFKKIADKAHDSRKEPRKSSIKQGRIHLQSTGSGSLSKAKIKTLKMTAVIIFMFIICGLPFFIAEMWRSYGNPDTMPLDVYAILGIFAVSNSTTNPYVFLLFNINDRFLNEFERTFGVRCPCRQESARTKGHTYSAPFRSRGRIAKTFDATQYNYNRRQKNKENIEVTILPSSSSSEKGFSPEKHRCTRLIGRGKEFKV